MFCCLLSVSFCFSYYINVMSERMMAGTLHNGRLWAENGLIVFWSEGVKVIKR